MIRFYVPHFGQSGGVAQILRTAAGLSKRGHNAAVCDLSESGSAPTWFDEPVQLVTLNDKSAVDVMYEAGPGQVISGPAILYRMNTNVWDVLQENRNLAAPWDGVLCVSRSLEADSRKRMPSAAVEYAPPGVDERLRAGEPTTEKTVGFLAHTASFKRSGELLQILHPLKEAGLRIIAYGPGYNSLIDEYYGRPTFAELATIYGRCALWLMPSAKEGFPLPPMEAAACGAVPIFANDREYDFKAGLSIPLADFGEAVSHLLADTERRLALRAVAAAEAEKYRGWSACVDAAERVINKVLA